MELGKKLQLARKKQGLSQEDLANLLNVSRQAVQKWESGASVPETSKLVQLSNILDVSIDFLLKDDVKENKEKEETPKVVETPTPKPVERTIYVQETPSIGVNDHSYKVIRVWAIIGAILTPLYVSSSLIKPLAGTAFPLLGLTLFAITIPLLLISLHVLKNARSKGDVVFIGILDVLFLSLIAGILILSLKDSDFNRKQVRYSTSESINVTPVVLFDPLKDKKEEAQKELKKAFDNIDRTKYRENDIKLINDLYIKSSTFINNATHFEDIETEVSTFLVRVTNIKTIEQRNEEIKQKTLAAIEENKKTRANLIKDYPLYKKLFIGAIIVAGLVFATLIVFVSLTINVEVSLDRYSGHYETYNFRVLRGTNVRSLLNRLLPEDVSVSSLYKSNYNDEYKDPVDNITSSGSYYAYVTKLGNQISSLEGLLCLKNVDTNAEYKMVKDITILDQYLSELTFKDFKGILHGNNYSLKFNSSRFLYPLIKENHGIIDNLNINISTPYTIEIGEEKGLFITSNFGSLYNVNVMINNSLYLKPTIEDDGTFGIICAINSGIIDSCSTNGNISVNDSKLYDNNIGGLIGYNTGIVENCSANISLKTGYHANGLIVGYNKGTISGAKSKGWVNQTYYGSSSLSTVAYNGGIAGINDHGYISHCINEAKISTNSSSETNVSCGGIVALSDGGTITSCYNLGNIDGNPTGEKYSHQYGKTYAGGIVGFNNENVEVKLCKNSGNITLYVEGANCYCGGIAGANTYSNTIHDSYNIGKIYAHDTSSSKYYANIGGIAGYDDGYIYDCYNLGEVKGNSYDHIGGIVGWASDNYSIKNCHFLNNVENGIYNKTDDTNVTKYTNEYNMTRIEMNLSSSYWNDGYMPKLKWENE